MLHPPAVDPHPPAKPARTGLLAPERAWLTIGLVLVVTMAAFEGLAVATVLPVAQEELGGLGLYGLVFVAFMLASLAGIWYAGRESDRRGPALPMALGLAVFAAGLSIGGAAPEMSVLIFGRAVQGLGAGAVITVAYVAIGRGYDETIRPRMFAVLSSAWVIPGLIGPSIAGAVAENLSWRLVFFGLLPFVVLGAATTLPYLRKMGKPEAHEASKGVVALLRGNRTLIRGVFVLGLLMMAFFGAEAYLPLMLTDVRGYSATIAGLALSSGTVFWTAGSWLQERRAKTWSRRGFISVGLALVGIGVALLIPVALGAPIWITIVAWAVSGFGIGMAYPVSTLSILGAAPSGQEGAASSAIQTSTVIGTAAGAGLGGALVAIGAAGAWSTETSVTLVFTSMLVFVALGIAAARGIRA